MLANRTTVYTVHFTVQSHSTVHKHCNMSAMPLLYPTSPAVDVSDVTSVAMLTSYSCCVIGTLPLTDMKPYHTDTVYPSACERERERERECVVSRGTQSKLAKLL